MLKSILGLSPVYAGLFAASLLTACGGGGGTCADGDSCDGNGSGLDGRDAGSSKSKDAGKDAKAAVTNSADGGNKQLGTKKYLPCDVQDIVTTKCTLCHGATPIGGAPMSLLTALDFQAQAPEDSEPYTTHVKDRVNQTDQTKHMPPVINDQLSDDQLATFNSWLDDGAIGVDTKCTTTSVTDGGTKGPVGDGGPSIYVEPTDDELECFNITAHSGDFKTPFKVGVAKDEYYTFTWSSPWPDTAYGIKISSIIDNAKALHHWLLFQDLVAGIPGGAVQEIGAHPSGQLLAVWAPGADDMDFRTLGQGVGLELPGGSNTYTLELHYNSSDAAAQDMSGAKVCVTKSVPPNVAAYSWLGNDNLTFPSTEWTGTCTPFAQTAPIHMVSFMPHMHLTGIHMKGTINRANGTKEVVHDQPFDFNYQKSYPIDLLLNPGDSLTTVCDYSQPQTFGQQTSKEMCYLFTMAYPKGALASPDVWGGIAHGASSCLGN